MRAGWLVLVGGLLLLRRVAGASSATAPARVDLRCDPDLDNPWGRSWGTERPPDLPWGARRPCERGSGRSLIDRLARRQGLGDAFARTVVHLADTESEATPGLPARRPHGSAAGWGAFQFNRGAWRALGRRQHGCEAPMPGAASMEAWEATVTEEIAGPVAMYACLWRAVTSRGGDALDAARAVRLWHTGSSYFGAYVGRAEALGSFRAAWSDLQEDPPNPRFADMLARTDGRMAELGFL